MQPITASALARRSSIARCGYVRDENTSRGHGCFDCMEI